MKRNKPFVKHRTSGGQNERRRKHDNARWEKRPWDWVLLVPAALEISRHDLAPVMGTAVPAGLGGTPMWKADVYRWRIDVDGQSHLVWAVAGSVSRYGRGRLPWALSGMPLDADGQEWRVYTSRRRCVNGPDCVYVHRFFADDGVTEVKSHRLGDCPAAVLTNALWKFLGTPRREGMDWYV